MHLLLNLVLHLERLALALVFLCHHDNTTCILTNWIIVNYNSSRELCGHNSSSRLSDSSEQAAAPQQPQQQPQPGAAQAVSGGGGGGGAAASRRRRKND